MTERFYIIEEAAPLLNLHPETLRRVCREGKINFGKAGRRFIFTREQLEQYVYKYGSMPLRRRYARLERMTGTPNVTDESHA